MVGRSLAPLSLIRFIQLRHGENFESVSMGLQGAYQMRLGFLPTEFAWLYVLLLQIRAWSVAGCHRILVECIQIVTHIDFTLWSGTERLHSVLITLNIKHFIVPTEHRNTSQTRTGSLNQQIFTNRLRKMYITLR
jgi:hypothetical protein